MTPPAPPTACLLCRLVCPQLLEGNSSSITFEDPQQSVPSSTVLLAITPAYTLSLYDDIQTRRERLIASRLGIARLPKRVVTACRINCG